MMLPLLGAALNIREEKSYSSARSLFAHKRSRDQDRSDRIT
jgi:hypothetical protein